ncbi:MAG TPA: acyltransferase [Geomonas sp.]|nr:acyltransferase [Geomonas sp.]
MKKNIHSLTGLRGVAAFVVFLAHAGICVQLPVLQHVAAFISWQNAAVDLFFVLSGFTLAYVYSGHTFDTPGIKKYLIARFARIYPLHLLTLLVSVYMVCTSPLRGYGFASFWPDFLRQLFLVNCWAPLGDGIFFNRPAWSISVETFCYIFLFPPLAIYAGRYQGKNDHRRTAVAVGLLMLLSYLIFTTCYNPDVVSYDHDHSAIRTFSFYVNILRGILGFSAGFVVYRSFALQDALYRFCSRYADYLFGAVLLIMLGQQLGLGLDNHMMLVLSPFLCLACASEAGFFNRVLSTKLLVHLGDLSYSVYLLHFVILMISDRMRLHLSTTFALVYLVSLASYYLYEVPARRIINRIYAAPARPVRSATQPSLPSS